MRHILNLLALLMPVVGQAQDVILRTNGQEVPAKVVRITPEQVIYLAGTDTTRIPSAEVSMVRYANGTKEIIKAVASVDGDTATGPLTPAQAEQLGLDDARQNFKANGAFWGTFGATLLSTPIYFAGGLITGGIMVATPPNKARFTPSKVELLQNPDYMRGYSQNAQKIKNKEAATGFAAGAGVGLATAALVAAVILTGYH